MTCIAYFHGCDRCVSDHAGVLRLVGEDLDSRAIFSGYPVSCERGGKPLIYGAMSLQLGFMKLQIIPNAPENCPDFGGELHRCQPAE